MLVGSSMEELMRRSFAIACLFLMGSSPALAGGVILYEVGTPEVGLASAGWAARAEDAATILTNPAGMTRLKKNDLMLGMQALYADMGFVPNGDTTTTGGDGGNPIGWFPGGGLFYVNPTSDRLRLGVAVTGNFGLGLDYEDDWVGRYYVQDATLIGLSVMPAIAWKVNDEFSIGMALNATYGVLQNTVAVNNVADELPDGSMKLEDATWGFGANLGVLYEPNAGTRFGLTYTSPVRLDFGDVPEFKNLGSGMQLALGAAGLLSAQIDLSMMVPQTVMTSFVRDLNDRWSLLGNVGWQDWSAFGKVDVQVGSADPTSLTVDQNFQDTWHAAFGARVKTGSPWSVSFGAAYDSSCVEDADRSPALPLGTAWRLGVGGRRAMSGSLDLGIAYELAWGGSLPVDQQRGPLAGRLAGSYEDTAMHFLTASLRWRL
jgi:long-chain fatty acid transport protein